NSAGTRSITVTDSDASVSGTQGGILVKPGKATSFMILGLPPSLVAGTAYPLFVYAVDAYGNTGATYTGTVHFTSSDNLASLPADYTFTAADNGSHMFMVTLRTAGTQWLKVTDTLDNTISTTLDNIIVA